MNESLNYIGQTIILIKYYTFDLQDYNIKELIIKWINIYPHNWLPLGVTEAIYQGRLKVISVEQILNIWLKKGHINQSFNEEFINIINPNINVDIKEYQEIYTKIMINNKQKSLENKEGKNINENNLLVELSLKKFQPMDDFSHCFKKLKNFTNQEDLKTK